MHYILLILFLPFTTILAIKELAWYSSNKGIGSSHSAIHAPLQADTAIDICQLPVDIGKCSLQLVRYYYDPVVDECKRFTFSGCGGNSNRFRRRAHCRNICVKQPEKLVSVQEIKHRRTVTTTTPGPTKKVEEVPKHGILELHQDPENGAGCKDCDPLYGTCIDGKCGCMKGFRSLGKVCIDLNECDNGAVCGPNARCVNEIGSFQCVCDAGFSTDGDCKIGQEACMDEFDVNLTEEDCNNGKQEIKYYYDSETVQCKQFFYGGCKTKSRNFFADLQTCDIVCVSNQRDYIQSNGQSLHHPTHQVSSDMNSGNDLKSNHYKVDLFSSPSSPVRPNRPLSADDWPLKPVTLKPALDLDFSQAHTKSTDEKQEEAKKVEKLVKELTPDHNVCDLKFEPVLREECISADWSEKFFWNSAFRDCEPFWYDSSCDPRDRAGKNFFESFDDCKKKCDGAQDSYVTPTENAEEEKVEEEQDVAEDTTEKVEEEIEHSEITTTTTKAPQESHEEHGFFFKVKPQNYLEDVLSTEEEDKVKHHNGFNPNEFLKKNAEKVKQEELKKVVPKQEEDVIARTDDKIEHDILDELKKEGTVEKILATPSTCELEYDADLRNECTSADWTELYYWNEQFKECEAFWYDSSCGDPEYEKKNLFKSYEDCNNKCVKKIGDTMKKTVPLTTTTSTTTTTTTSTTTEAPTASSVLLEETKRPNHKQNDPLNLILNKALKPDESSELPEKFPPNHEKTFVNFAMKSEVTATTKFDRLKYMAEFRKKLLALPDNFSTSGKPTSPTSAPSTTLKVEPSTHETNVTQTEKPSTSTAPTQTTTTTTFEDFVEAEKKKVLETIKILDRPDDLCDEPLHPKLEEDCKNDQWEIKWFFNSDRGACKSFWYGGCEVESRNFFPDHANCRHTCAHKYGTPASFSSKVYIPPGDLSTPTPPRKDRLTTSLKLTYPHSEDLFPEQKHATIVELDGNFQRVEEKELLRLLPTKSFKQNGPLPTAGNIVNVSEGDKAEIEPAFYSHIDRVVHDMKSGGHPGYTKPEEFVRRIEAASNDYIKYDFQKPEVVTIVDKSPPTVPTITWKAIQHKTTEMKSEPTNRTPTTRSINDPCDDEYDPKWDEDCLGDSWVVRSYYDPKAEACKAFWYGGCHTSSRNIWFDKETCRSSCAHKFPTNSPMIIAPNGDQSHEVVSSESQDASSSSSSSSPSASSSNTAHISPEHRFKVDLDQKFADIKREHEGREDLEYSKMVDHPVTVAADCLEVFNQSLSQPCDGKTWSNRYYYDKDTRSCRMFWSNGCFDSSKNNFDDQETCQWKCEGRHPQPAGKSCLDKFDERYLEDCRHGEFTNRFYFDHDRKKCVAFHWGGCQSKSQNFFADMAVCQDLCESPPRELTQACIQPFDKNYENSCSAEKPQQYYYFDSSSGICKMFWFGNCKGENENIFSTLEACQWICERKREERKPAICADKFDQKYTESCGNSQWTEKWYFDQSSGDCTSFWWDGCISSSQNIFPDEKSCTSNCKHPGFEISSKLASEDSKFRCLEPVEIGNCQETYPAFYYDRTSRSCRPFAYSGCGGNSNRFMTVSQCENLCFAFNSMNEAEVDCHLPMHIGYGKNEDSCLPQAGFRFYYDRNYGKCSQMWYLGCGGNANNFYSYEICQRTCSQSDQPRELERKTRASSEGRPKFGIRKIRARVQQL